MPPDSLPLHLLSSIPDESISPFADRPGLDLEKPLFPNQDRQVVFFDRIFGGRPTVTKRTDPCIGQPICIIEDF